jgi:hypothetical protein
MLWKVSYFELASERNRVNSVNTEPRSMLERQRSAHMCGIVFQTCRPGGGGDRGMRSRFDNKQIIKVYLEFVASKNHYLRSKPWIISDGDSERLKRTCLVSGITGLGNDEFESELI